MSEITTPKERFYATWRERGTYVSIFTNTPEFEPVALSLLNVLDAAYHGTSPSSDDLARLANLPRAKPGIADP